MRIKYLIPVEVGAVPRELVIAARHVARFLFDVGSHSSFQPARPIPYFTMQPRLECRVAPEGGAHTDRDSTAASWSHREFRN